MRSSKWIIASHVRRMKIFVYKGLIITFKAV